MPTRTPSTARCAPPPRPTAARSGPGASACTAWRLASTQTATTGWARPTFPQKALPGISCVGEFHYLHHQPGGHPYADPNAMGRALVQAAADAGLRITLLDTCYLSGGLVEEGLLPLAGPQLRFGDGDAVRWAARVTELGCDSRGMIAPHAQAGAAIHSVRAGPRGQVP